MERIVFGDPSDIINNLSDSEFATCTEAKEELVDNTQAVDNNQDEIESEDDVVVVNDKTDETGQRRAAWVDDDDVTYTSVYKDKF